MNTIREISDIIRRNKHVAYVKTLYVKFVTLYVELTFAPYVNTIREISDTIRRNKHVAYVKTLYVK